MHATILHCSLFIVHWPHFIVHSFHNIVQPDVQHVVHNANCAIVYHFEQFVPTLVTRPCGARAGVTGRRHNNFQM